MMNPNQAPGEPPKRVSARQTRQIHNGMKSVIGDRPFLVIVPEMDRATSLVSSLPRESMIALLAEALANLALMPDKDIPPPIVMQSDSAIGE